MNPIRTALCAYGMSGRVFHGPLLEAHPGFKITKILERNRNDSAKKHPQATQVRKWEELMDDKDIELVIVNTPDPFHYTMAREALTKGKHVVVEKPFTLHVREANELISLAHQRGLILTVFQNRRWDGDFLTIQEIIREKKLGRLVDFESHFDRYRNYLQDSWKEDSASGTGTLYNLGSHLADQALQLFGLPDRLFCDVRMLREGASTDDSFDLFLYYPDVKCMLRSSYLAREPGPRFILHGTEGSYLKWGVDPQEEDLNQERIPGSDGWGTESQSKWGKINSDFQGHRLEGPYPTLPGNYLAFYENVFKAIRFGNELEVKAEEARNVIKIIELAYQSGREARVMQVK